MQSAVAGTTFANPIQSGRRFPPDMAKATPVSRSRWTRFHVDSWPHRTDIDDNRFFFEPIRTLWWQLSLLSPKGGTTTL